MCQGLAGIQLPFLTTALVLLLDSSGRVSVLALPGCGLIDQGVAAAAAPPEAAALAATGSTQAGAADAGQAREDTGADRLCLLLLLLLCCTALHAAAWQQRCFTGSCCCAAALQNRLTIANGIASNGGLLCLQAPLFIACLLRLCFRCQSCACWGRFHEDSCAAGTPTVRRRDRRYAVAFAQDQSGELPGSPMPGVTPRTAGYVLGIESAVQLPLLSACVVTSRVQRSSRLCSSGPMGHLPGLSVLGGTLGLQAIALGKQCICFCMGWTASLGRPMLGGRPWTAARHSEVSSA